MKIYGKRLFALMCALCLAVFSAEASARTLVPVGKTVGITVMMNGVTVAETAKFNDSNGNSVSPAETAGIKSGDIIEKINGTPITSAKILEEQTDKSGKSEMKVTCRRGNEEFETELCPEMSQDGSYHIGVIVRDSEAGIGTITYYDAETGEFGALGHGICDASGKLFSIVGGETVNAEITSVKRGERGCPGELMGVFGGYSDKIGDVTENSELGIFGRLKTDAKTVSERDAVETAERCEVTEGEATVLSNVEGDSVCEYSAEIVKINKDENNAKGMIVKIKDAELIEKTGGIVQGMSGSPILQNGKLVGAVTHVFISDPTKGYGIFIDKMLNEN